MGWVLTLSMLLTALGPAVVVFWMVVTPRAELVILSITSAFFWLISISFASLLRMIIPPLREVYWVQVIISVTCQEVARYLYYKVYVKAEAGFRAPMSNRVQSSIASGIGFGVAHGAIMYAGVLSYSTGPGALYAHHCRDVSLFVTSAFMCSAWIGMHTSLMTIAWHAYLTRNKVYAALVVVLHFIFSLMTLGNSSDGGCIRVLVAAWVMAPLVGAATTFMMIKAPRYGGATFHLLNPNVAGGRPNTG